MEYKREGFASQESFQTSITYTNYTIYIKYFHNGL